MVPRKAALAAPRRTPTSDYEFSAPASDRPSDDESDSAKSSPVHTSTQSRKEHQHIPETSPSRNIKEDSQYDSDSLNEDSNHGTQKIQKSSRKGSQRGDDDDKNEDENDKNEDDEDNEDPEKDTGNKDGKANKNDNKKGKGRGVTADDNDKKKNARAPKLRKTPRQDDAGLPHHGNPKLNVVAFDQNKKERHKCPACGTFLRNMGFEVTKTSPPHSLHQD